MSEVMIALRQNRIMLGFLAFSLHLRDGCAIHADRTHDRKLLIIVPTTSPFDPKNLALHESST